jgi:pimeloyl-ACP methyl ester carboxylesterase
MSGSPPLWIEPENDSEARLALDILPGASSSSRLWFFIHGLGSSRRGEKALYFAKRVARGGDAFASLDLTGHGDSGGDLLGLCLSRNLGDLDRGLRFAEDRAGPFSAIHLVGSSMGGLTVLWYSALNPGRAQANITIAPAFEMAGRLLLRLGRRRAERWRREERIRIETDDAERRGFDLGYGFVRDETRYPIAALAERLGTPTLILHGSRDESVPCQLSRRFAERVSGVKLVVIDNGDHRLADHKEALFEEMQKFVSPSAGRF